MMTDFTLPQLIAIWALPLLFAITLHEVAHGWAALKLGDTTAKAMGRLSLNPIHHIDPVGTIAVPIGLLIVSSLAGSGMIFGWAKPVPVSWGNLKKPRRDIALVALAGPGANLLMAIGWAILAKIGLQLGDNGIFLYYVGSAGVLINSLLMVLNLLPILPLDGGRVLYTFLPARLAYVYARSEPYGFIVLLVLLLSGALGIILTPFLLGVLTLIEAIVG